jgi:hypothetical protein
MPPSSVDEDLSGFDVVDEALLLGFIACPGVGPQPERRGDFDSLVDVGGTVHDATGPNTSSVKMAMSWVMSLTTVGG